MIEPLNSRLWKVGSLGFALAALWIGLAINAFRRPWNS